MTLVSHFEDDSRSISTEDLDDVTQETEARVFVQLIAGYDVYVQQNRLYRNGELEFEYTPGENDGNTFFTSDGSEDDGVRIMFCKRFMNVGLKDFAGIVRYGAFYDYALDSDDASQIYSNKILQFGDG